MNHVKVSVIIPVYKTEKYLNQCIESVCRQTHENLEIILIDDGSPDHCPKICDEWAEKDRRIKVIHKKNGGVSAARNTALDIAAGEYVTFVDSDDFIEPDMLETMLEKAFAFDADAAVCGFTFEVDGSKAIPHPCSSFHYQNGSALAHYLNDAIRPEACGKLIKKAVLNGLRFQQNIHYAEDLLFNYYLFKVCKTVVGIENSKYHYRQNSGNSSTTAYLTDARAAGWKVLEEILLDCRHTELYELAVKRFTVGVFGILSRIMQEPAFCSKYFSETANVLLKYRGDILKNPYLTKKYKISLYFLSVNQNLFKKMYLLINRIRP